MKRRKIMYAAIAVAALVSALTAASSPAATVGFGPRLGYQRATGADEGNFMGGVALRAMLIPFLGVEGSVDYRQQDVGEGDPLTIRSWPVQVTGLVYPIPNLYGALGAGWYNTTFDYDDDAFPGIEDDTSQEFGWHLGGGLQFNIGPGALAADIRYVFLNLKFEDIPEIPADDRDSNFYMATVAFLFGLDDFDDDDDVNDGDHDD